MNRLQQYFAEMTEPDLIKLGAIAAAVTRWVVALGASEGLSVPAEWIPGWRVASFLLATMMAITEALGFNYAFKAWSKTRSKILMGLVLASALTFVIVLTPSIAAATTGKAVYQVMSDWFLVVWSAMVALSTILLVGTVGYAQSENGKYAQPTLKVTQSLEVKGISTLGLTDGQARVLAYLMANPAATNNEIYTELSLPSLPTLYGILGQLSKRGLVQPQPDGSRRVIVEQEQ
jgi:hypothetical protein